MNYEQALNFIHSTHKFGSKLGLHNISVLLELMGNPHKKLRFVHVAGTNGKGSTVSFISSILIQAGYKTGIFISPYIERFTERIKIGNDDIPADDLARITEFVKEKVDIMLQRGENHPTEFEIVTAIALQYYFENNCDVVVLEVGLGGRFDSTNIIDTPLVSVITTIGYDHMDRLGGTLSEIAFEKAGIIKENGSVVVYHQAEEVEKVFRDTCTEKNSKLSIVDFATLKLLSCSVDGQVFDFEDYHSLEISLLGEHQTRNAAVAIKTVEVLREKGLNIQEQAIRNGLIKARWPGRLEIMNKTPFFLIDGAHNVEGAKVLVDALKKYFPGKRIFFILGVLKDKDFRSMIEIVAPLAHCFITVTPNNDRALTADELSKIIAGYCNNVYVSDTIESAIRTSLEFASQDDVICAFGSLYYIGEVRKHFKHLQGF
jgi:dihydrofolate synthase/folylpolyglutamate synthase